MAEALMRSGGGQTSPLSACSDIPVHISLCKHVLLGIHGKGITSRKHAGVDCEAGISGGRDGESLAPCTGITCSAAGYGA